MSVKWDYMAELTIAARERDEAIARADRIADRAVMLESRLAEIARLMRDEISFGFWSKRIRQALAVAEGES